MNDLSNLKRPILRYHGGKWLLAPWIISHFPPHRVYTEVYGGAGSVLMRKPRSYAEIYNDLEDEVVNLFRILRDQESNYKLLNLLKLTPFSRTEFDLAYNDSEDNIENARRLITRSFMGFGSDCHNKMLKSGFRANSNRSGSTPAHDWINYPDNLINVLERLRGVTIENRQAIDILRQHDGKETLHYIDPPYVHSTRSRKRDKNISGYVHEMTDDDHRELSDVLHDLKGMIILSGYPCELYEGLYPSWYKSQRAALADGAKPRTEVLWMNQAALDYLHGPLFN